MTIQPETLRCSQGDGFNVMLSEAKHLTVDNPRPAADNGGNSPVVASANPVRSRLTAASVFIGHFIFEMA